MTSNSFARPNEESFIDKVHTGHLPTGTLCAVATVTRSCEQLPVIDPCGPGNNAEAGLMQTPLEGGCVMPVPR